MREWRGWNSSPALYMHCDQSALLQSDARHSSCPPKPKSRRSSDVHALAAGWMTTARSEHLRSWMPSGSPRTPLTNAGRSHCCRAAWLAPGAGSLMTPPRPRIAGDPAAASCRRAPPPRRLPGLPVQRALLIPCPLQALRPHACCGLPRHHHNTIRSSSGRQQHSSRRGNGPAALGCTQRQTRRGRRQAAAATWACSRQQAACKIG